MMQDSKIPFYCSKFPLEHERLSSKITGILDKRSQNVSSAFS
jgi:hypothetical protein